MSVAKLWVFILVGDDEKLGLILGYPKCCVEFFCNNFSSEKTNLELKPTNPWTNLSQRSEDCVLLSHFPCHSDCEPSMELGKKYLDLLRNVDMVRTKELVESLKRD